MHDLPVSRALLTNQTRTCNKSLSQSERFFQTDQLVIRLQVVVVTNFIRMLSGNVIVNVFKSDAVIWWAAIFRKRAGGESRMLSVEPSLLVKTVLLATGQSSSACAASTSVSSCASSLDVSTRASPTAMSQLRLGRKASRAFGARLTKDRPAFEFRPNEHDADDLFRP